MPTFTQLLIVMKKLESILNESVGATLVHPGHKKVVEHGRLRALSHRAKGVSATNLKELL